jgi:hypothetical protein
MGKGRDNTRTNAPLLLAAIERIIRDGQAGGPVLQVEQIYGLLTSPMAAWLVGKTEAEVLGDAEKRGWRQPERTSIDLYLDSLRVERRLGDDGIALHAEDLARVSQFAAQRATPIESLDYDALKAFIVEQCPERSIRDLHTFATILDFYRFLLLDGRIEKNPAAPFEESIAARERAGERWDGR